MFDMFNGIPPYWNKNHDETHDVINEIDDINPRCVPLYIHV
jgi:hypothetical protein